MTLLYALRAAEFSCFIGNSKYLTNISLIFFVNFQHNIKWQTFWDQRIIIKINKYFFFHFFLQHKNISIIKAIFVWHFENYTRHTVIKHQKISRLYKFIFFFSAKELCFTKKWITPWELRKFNFGLVNYGNKIRVNCIINNE